MLKRLSILIFVVFGFLLIIKPAHAGIISKPVFNNGLVGYWDFQEGAGSVAHDRTGYHNDCTLSSAMDDSHWIDGKLGKALTFNDGHSTDYADCGNPTELQLTTVGTIAVWVKLANGTNYDNAGVISKNDWVNDVNGYSFNIPAATHKAEGELANATTPVTIDGNTNLDDNSWHYVVFTWDTYLHMYVDGREDATPVARGAITPISNVWNLQFAKIAGYGGSNYYFDGKLDEVRIYNRALSANEVQRLYNLSQPKTLSAPRNGLVGYWSFNEGTGTKVGDMSGTGNTGTWQGSGAHWTEGKFGKAGNFTGANNYVSIPYTPSLQLTHPAAVSAWAYFISTPGAAIINSGTGGPVANFDIGIESDGRLYVFDTGAHYFSPNYYLPKNQWVHLIVNYLSSSKTDLYVNGKYYGTATGGLGATNMTLACIGINCYFASAEYFVGKIDEVRIYSRDLDPTEITALYKSGLQKIGASQANQITNGLVGYWSFNGPDISGTDAFDRSGQGNHGVISGAVPTIGKIGQALDFDGGSFNGDSVKVNHSDSLNITGPITISAWIKPRSIPGSCTGVVEKGSYTTSYCFGTSGNSPYTGLEFWYGGVQVAATANGILKLNQWQHVAVSYSSSGTDIYLNGESVKHSTTTASPAGNSSQIGIGWRDSNPCFDGAIDEVRIYNRALEPWEIKRLYNLGR